MTVTHTKLSSIKLILCRLISIVFILYVCLLFILFVLALFWSMLRVKQHSLCAEVDLTLFWVFYEFSVYPVVITAE